MIRRALVLVLLLMLSSWVHAAAPPLYCGSVDAQVICPDQATAQSIANAWIAYQGSTGNPNSFKTAVQSPLPAQGQHSYLDICFAASSACPGSGSLTRIAFVVGNSCNAGQILPAGTHYLQSATTGEACTSGANSCEMSYVLGGPNSGAQMLTGKSCPATGLPDKGPIPTSSETVNADGSKTYCDPISGKCVTVKPAPPVAPASSSSSANNSTDTASTTHNPASSSSSTTTTTTTGDGGSGTGTGSGSSTGVSTTKTDNPATASSTASKCTTGACDVGNADGNIGDLYEAGTDTPASVYNDFKAQVSSSPLMSAATGFFNASSISGTCPIWHIPGNKYWGMAGFDFAFFCADGMLAILALAGYLVLAVGAFSAFRIAIY